MPWSARLKGFVGMSFCLAAGAFPSGAQPVDVSINVNMTRTVGGISTFDREKFITIHSTHTDGDWDGGQNGSPNFTNNLLADFVLGQDVYFGRDTGYVSWYLKNRIDEAPGMPGWPRISGSTYSMATQGLDARNAYESDTAVHSYEVRNRTGVMGAQFRPFWPDGVAGCGRPGLKWPISTTDTVGEPFGTATGNYMGHFLKEFYGTPENSHVGRPLPLWVEVMNEHDWPLFEWPGDPAYGTSSPAQLWRFHNSVADQIRSLNTNVLIGGYCPAFPDLERDNFQEWTNEWVTFIDTCGPHMDFYAIHLYDIDDSSKYLIRRGSFTEAVMDMIEHYSRLQLGNPLPFVISEYAGKDQMLSQQGWSALHDWKRVKSMSGYLMSFMDRPHLVGKTIPFIVVKAEWGRNPTTGIPYGARLMRQTDEAINPTHTTGDWVYTEHVKWYRLWSDVKGTRVDIVSSDPDIQTDAYVNGDKAYVILNNLTRSTELVDLHLFEDHGNILQGVREKNLYWNGSNIALDDISHVGSLAQVQLRSEGTAVLEYDFADPVDLNHTSDEVKHYATTYFQSISSNVARVFHINGVNKGAHGAAVLRLGMGRDIDLSRQPEVVFNGVPLTVPTDFMGHEGDDRSIFFGLLDIPVPYALLQPSNTVSITYPDSGGYISSVALRAFEFSKPRAVVLRAPVISSAAAVGPHLNLAITNGTHSGYFHLLSSTDVQTPVAGWSTNQAWLRFDTNGMATVTNLIAAGQEFYRVMETGPPPPPGPAIIDFTAPDYEDGPLDGQQTWNAESGWMVADASGSGHVATPDNGSAAVLGEAITLVEGQTYSLGINLQFGGSYSTPTGFVYLALGGLKDNSAGVSLPTDNSAADANIQIIANTDNYRLLNTWTPVAGQITTGALDAGDVLQYDYALTLGSDAATTFYTVRLRNLTDGTDTGVGTVIVVDSMLHNALTSAGAHGFFQTITPGANGSGLSGLRVNSVSTQVSP